MRIGYLVCGVEENGERLPLAVFGNIESAEAFIKSKLAGFEVRKAIEYLRYKYSTTEIKIEEGL